MVGFEEQRVAVFDHVAIAADGVVLDRVAACRHRRALANPFTADRVDIVWGANLGHACLRGGKMREAYAGWLHAPLGDTPRSENDRYGG